MTDIVAVSVAFKERYIAQQKRLADSLYERNVDFMYWPDVYPPGSRTHEESLYGFKVHAVKAARSAGFEKILWLDTAMICQGSVNYYFDPSLPAVLAVRDDSKLENTISDKALLYFDNPEIIDWHLVGGSLYAFDFTKQACIDIFTMWERAEKDGAFGSVEESITEQINKHRHDESCLAVSLYTFGKEPVSPDIARYNQGRESLFIKDHFK